MKKKIVKSIGILALMVLIGLLMTAQDSGNANNNRIPINQLRYYARDGSIIITEYTGPGGNIAIPAALDGLPVAVIWESAFLNKNLTSVIIPNGVTSIGSSAFRSNRLTSVTIPNGVTSIGDSAFMQNLLTSVTIPNSVTSIRSLALAHNRLTSVTIPNSVTIIGGFEYNQLTSITILNGANMTTIGAMAFAHNQLTSVTIPNSVTAIEAMAFMYNQLTSITIGANVRLSASDSSPPSFGYGFENIYYNGGQAAGTYTRSNLNSTDWTRR